MPSGTAPAEVVGDRYLASPAALEARPFGPVDAIDTHSGRAAQVRLLFVPGAWGEAELSDAVARWCRIGCAEVCGVLDVGRHEGRWYLVVPPALGMPVERWRSLRRAGAGDAARLVLAFGRLLEHVAGAGFSTAGAAVADFTVGPGPTPFLERPLLGPPRPGGLDLPDDDGPRTLAALLDAAADPRRPLPGPLAEWSARARGDGFADLAEALDALEQAAEAVSADGDGAAPGLDDLFDDGDPPLLPPADRWRGVAGVAAAVLALLGAGVMLFGGAAADGGGPAAPAVAAPAVVAPAAATVPAGGRAREAGRRVTGGEHRADRAAAGRADRRRTDEPRPRRTDRPRSATPAGDGAAASPRASVSGDRPPAAAPAATAPAAASPAPAPAPPASASAPQPAPAAGAGATTLPAPGGAAVLPVP